jgi:PAS domain S-box-containing protein
MNKRGLDNLRRKAEEDLSNNDRKIKGMGKADLATMAHELAVHQAELEIQNEELRESRALVEETKERYQELFDFAPVGYFTLDEHNRIVEINLTGYQLLKVDQGKLKNKIFTRFISDDETNSFYLQRKKALENEFGRNFTLKMKKADGTSFLAQLDIIKSGEGRLRVAISDITERKKAEDTQKQSEENYRTLFNSIDEGFCTVEVIFDNKGKSIDYRFLEINPAFERQTGLHDAEGKLMRSLAPEHEEHWFQIYGRIALTGKSERFINEAKALNRWYDVYAFRVGAPESRKVAILFNDITARKKAEDDLAKAKDELEIKVQERTAELKDSEEKYHTIVETADEGIWICDTNAKTTFVNKKMAEMLGYSNKYIMGKTPYEFMDQEAKDLAKSNLERRLKGHSDKYEQKYIRKDGSTLWAIASATPLVDKNNHVIASLGMITDITALKQAEEENRELLETANSIIIRWDYNRKIKFINDFGLRFFGYSADELIGNDIMILVPHVDTHGRHMDIFVKDIITNTQNHPSSSNENIRKDGSIVQVMWTNKAIYDSQGQGKEILAIGNDITELKVFEEQLHQRAEELETVMNVVPAAIWVAHDPACHNITGNQTANRFYEAEEGENVSAGPALGEPVPERHFFRNGKELTAEELPMQEAAARNVDIEGSEFDVLLPSGKSRTLWGSASPLRNDDGQVRGVVAAFVDITDRTREQEKLKESDDRFSKAFHSSPVALSISRINDGTFIDVNQSFLNTYGYSREELIGQKATELNIYDNPGERKEIVRQLEKQGKLLNYEVTARTKAGAEINALTSAEKIEINGQAHIIWTTIDITDRKKAEKEVFQLNRELKAINECDQVIVHANDEQTLLSDVCHILCTSAGYRMAWVSSVERDEAKSVRPLAWCGDEEYITKARITWADDERGRGPTGLAARNNKTYFFQDFAAEPAAAPWREAALLRGFRSSIALPLADDDGKVFAVFTLYSAEPNYFNATEVKLLEMLTGDLAFGINGLREREKRKSAESEILHLASFPELNPNPIIELDFSGNVKYANPAAKRDFPLMTQEHKQAFLMDLFDAIQKDKTHSVTKDINTGVSWYEQTLVYVPDTKSYLLYGRNITSRKIAEESLKQSEEKFRSMNFTMNEGVCLHEIIYDESGKGVDYKILDINPAYEQITGLTRAKAIGKTASELYGTGTPPYFDIYERVAASGKPESFETYFPPMRKYFSISAFSPQKGRFGTVFNDITERRRSEEEKQQLMDKITDAQKQTLSNLEAMTRLQKLGTLSLQEGNIDSILTEIVDAAIAISGADFGNIQLLDPDTHDLKIVAYRGYPDWWLDFWSTVSKGKGTCGTALERGERVIVEDVEQSPIFIGTPALDIQLKADIRGIQSTPLVSRSGKTLGMFSTQYKTPHRPDDRTLRLLDLLARQAADIIESKAADDELKRRTAELEASNKELEAFSYSVSHDLRAPLRSITGFSAVLLEDYNDELDKEGKSYLKKISDSGELMGQLMDDLLKLSRVTRSDLTIEKVDLSDMAQKIISDLASDEPKRKVKVTIAPNMTANGDKNLLGLVLQNLLGNAWKYTSKTLEPRIEMGTVEYIGKQAYFVRDNGVGFDMTYANKLFQPFQRLHKATEFAGTGIGLATVQRIIRRHGGEVWAEAKVGEGATFYFTLN